MAKALSYLKETKSKDFAVIKSDPQYDPLQSYPAFKRKLENAKHYQKKASKHGSVASSVQGETLGRSPPTKAKGGTGTNGEEVKS